MNQRGQALIEVAVFVLFTIGLIAAFLGFTKHFLIRQKLLLAAREGMLLYSSGHFEKEEVRDRMRAFLSSGSPRLHPSRIRIELDPPDTWQVRLYGLDRITVSYTTQSSWYRWLSLNPIMEETCFIKHANNYGPSTPGLWGPPVRPRR